MRILGIDPALSTTGYGVIEVNFNSKERQANSDKDIALVEAGVITTKATDTLEKRLELIYKALTKLVNDTQPQVLVIEKIYSHYRHPTTSYLLGHARGVICLVSAMLNIKLVEYAATKVKKAVVGKGLASKHQVQYMVSHTLEIDNLPKYNDVTDALALAITHSYFLRANRIRANL